ncbi:MAG TPA: heme exporter protein CcmD [Albitalea sp.]
MNWNELVSLGGHAPYVLGSVAVCLGVMALEVSALRARSRAARRAMGSALPFAAPLAEGGAA